MLRCMLFAVLYFMIYLFWMRIVSFSKKIPEVHATRLFDILTQLYSHPYKCQLIGDFKR